MFRNINRKTSRVGDATGSIQKGFAIFCVPGNNCCLPNKVTVKNLMTSSLSFVLKYILWKDLSLNISSVWWVEYTQGLPYRSMNDISAKEYFSGIHGAYPVMNFISRQHPVIWMVWFDWN